MSLRCICLLFHCLYAYAAVVIVGNRDLGMVANTSVSLSLDLIPASLAPVELTVTVSNGFSAGVSAASTISSRVVVRWERGQSKQFLYVRSSQCIPSGTLTLSATNSTNTSFVGIVPAPSSVNLYCAFPGRIDVTLPDGLSPSDLTLRDGQSVNVIFRAIRRRAASSSEGGIIPLNLPPGIQSNQNGSVLFPRFRSDQLSTEIQVNIFPDATAPRVSTITFGPVQSDDPEWKGVVPLPSLVLNAVHPGNITVSPASLACLVGSKTTFAISLSAPSENEINVGVTLPTGLSLATGLSAIVLPPGSTGPFFVDVSCTTTTAGAITFSSADSLDAAFDNAPIGPSQLSIYSTLPARIDLRDNKGVALSPTMRLLVQGAMSFRVVLSPASSRFIGSGGGQIRLIVSPGFSVTPSPIRFGALVGPLEVVVTVNSTTSSTARGNLTFTPCVSVDPQWQNLLPSSPFSTITLVPVRQASISLQGPSQVLLGQVSTLTIVPSAPAFSVVHLTLATSTGFKLGLPILQDSIKVDIPANFTGPINISLTSLAQSGGTVAITNIETDDVQYQAAVLPSLNITSFAAGNLVFRFLDGSPLPPVLSILIGQTYSLSLLVDRGNGVLNSTLPSGQIPFIAPTGFVLARAGQVLNSVIPFEALPAGVASRAITLTLTSANVLQGNISFGSVSSTSIVWSELTPQPAVLVIDAVQPATIAVSVSTLTLLTSSTGIVSLRTNVRPGVNVSLALSVPAGFRIRMNPAIVSSSVSNTSSTSSSATANSTSSSALFFPASNVVVAFPTGVFTLSLTIQADSTVHSFSLLTLSSVTSTDVQFNSILPSVNAITLSSTERGRLTVTLPWDGQQPLLVVAGSLVNISLAFNGDPSTGGTLVAVCPGFTFVDGGNSASSSSVITFSGNSTVNVTLLAPNVTGYAATLNFLNVSSQNVEWDGVQADVPQISLRVVEVPSFVILNTSLPVRVNQSATFFVRIRPSSSFPVSIPASFPRGCTSPAERNGSFTIPANYDGAFPVKISCTYASPPVVPPIISLGNLQSADRLLNGVVVTPTNNISLVIFSPGKITVFDDQNNVSLASNSSSSSTTIPLAFPMGVVVFRLVFETTSNSSGLQASRARNKFNATAPRGCPFLPAPGVTVLNDSFTAEISFPSPNTSFSSLLLSLNCSVAAGAKAGSYYVLTFSEVNSTNVEWNQVNVSPFFINFTLFSLIPITVSTESLIIRYPNPSFFTLTVANPPDLDVLIPFSISQQFAVRNINNESLTVIIFPKSQTQINVSVYALTNGGGNGGAKGTLKFSLPFSDDPRFVQTRIRPSNIINLLSIAIANVTINDPYNRASNSELNNVIDVRNSVRNITLNFTWFQITNLTTTFALSMRGNNSNSSNNNNNFEVSPGSFSFRSGSQKSLSLPVVLNAPPFSANSSLVLRVTDTTDPQWTGFLLRIPVVSIQAASINATLSKDQVFVGDNISISLQSSLVPSSNVSIRVILPPSLQWISTSSVSPSSNINATNATNATTTATTNLNRTVVRLRAGTSSANFTVVAVLPSPCGSSSQIQFDVNSDDESFASTSISPDYVRVLSYGRVNVLNGNGATVDSVVWRRNQVNSLNYSLAFFDSCNGSLTSLSSLPPLLIASSSPQLQAQSSSQCLSANSSAPICSATLSVYSTVTWWNDSRVISISLNPPSPVNNNSNNNTAVANNTNRVLATLPVFSNFQGGGTVETIWLTESPYFVNESVLVRFLFAPPPVRAVSLNFANISGVLMQASNTVNISAGQAQASMSFFTLTPGNFSWPYTVNSTDTIYTSLETFSFDVLPPIIPDTPSPSPAPSRRTVRPTRSPTLRPTRRPSSPQPSTYPTVGPTLTPTAIPSSSLTLLPSRFPTLSPTAIPTVLPTSPPSLYLTPSPTTLSPTTYRPSLIPTHSPTTNTPSTAAVIPTTNIPTTNIPTINIPTTNIPTTNIPTATRAIAAVTVSPTTTTPTIPVVVILPTPRSLRPTTHVPTSKPTFLRRTSLPTVSPSPGPTLAPSTVSPSLAPSSNKSAVNGTQAGDVPRRAQLSLNVTTDPDGNIDGMNVSQFLAQFSSDLTSGLQAVGLTLAPGQLTAVSLSNQTSSNSGRRLLNTENILVDLNLLPASGPGQNSSDEVYNSLGAALRSRDERLLGYSNLTRTINPNYFPGAVVLRNCSGGSLAVTCAPTSNRGVAVAPTGFDPQATSPIGSLKWWAVIVIAVAIVLFLCLLCCFLIWCCCKKKRPEPVKQAAPVPAPKPKPVVVAGPVDGSHGVQLAAVPLAKKATSARAIADEKKGDTPSKPLTVRPPIAVVIKADGAKWRCSKCTYDNDSGATACSICGAPKGTRVATLTHLAPMPGLIDERKKMSKKKHRQSDGGTPGKVELKEIAVEPVPENVFGAVDQVEWAAKPELVTTTWDGPEQKQPPDEEGFEEVPEDAELVVDRPPPELPSWERLTTYPTRPSEVSPEHTTLIAPSLSRHDPGTSSTMAVDEDAVDRIGAALGGEEGVDEGDEEEDEAEDPAVRAARKQARQERRLERRAKKAARKEEKRKRREATGEVVGRDDSFATSERAPSEFASEAKSVNSSIDDDRGSGVIDDEGRLARKAERKEKKRAKKESRREKKSKRAVAGEGGDDEEVEAVDHAVEPGATTAKVIAPIPEEGEGEEHPEG